MAGLIRGKIIVQGVQYSDVPGHFEEIGDEYGIHVQGTNTAAGTRVSVVQQPLEDADHPYAHYRHTN